ncbi:MAG: PLD nuclease N-terminal domain-containing protein [Chloroflexota bacterium]
MSDSENSDNSDMPPQKIPNLRTLAKTKGRKTWSDLSTGLKARIIGQIVVQGALFFYALWDLSHRPSNKVKGDKRLWTVALFVQPIGPISYLVFGRKR